MKKKLLFLCALLIFSISIYAQSYREVVYLKNGSIIKGVLIEQVPNVSLKIKTSDGNTFAYQMDEVEKITKEEADDSFNRNKNRNKNGIGKSPRTNGYRGFVELGGGFGVGDGDGIFSFQTSHGYQFNPYFYLGAGMGIDYHFDWSTVFMPIFANIRTNFLNKSITPFFDAKIGYSPFDGKGVYFNPSLGVSFGVNKRTALNFSFGYNMQIAKTYDYYYDNYSYQYDYEYNQIIGGMCFKLGVEF